MIVFLPFSCKLDPVYTSGSRERKYLFYYLIIKWKKLRKNGMCAFIYLLFHILKNNIVTVNYLSLTNIFQNNYILKDNECLVFTVKRITSELG